MRKVANIIDYSDSLILSAFELKGQRALLAKGRQRSYERGALIFARGDEGSWALLIEEGIVEISMVSLNGRKSVLNHMTQGDILGEIALLDRLDRSADAVATSDVKGIILSRQAVFDMLKSDTDACFSIMETLCARVRNASDMFETLSLTSASARLARCLIRVANKWGNTNPDGSINIDQHFSQSELGELAGIARENVNRHLKAWIQDQLILFDKGQITLLAPDKLTEIAEL
jgi:CRP/FNR family cyclic AMP-dependent transcriptional regulator